MPTPPKPFAVLMGEGKSHRTKAELEQRRQGEAALCTGEAMKEWPGTKANPVAHRQFQRLKKLLKSIGKDDALHEAVINRYCMILAEVTDLEADRVKITERQALIDRWVAIGEMDEPQHLAESNQLMAHKLAVEKLLSPKRKMLLDMEKENVMTIASALRSIPKKPEAPEQPSKMAALLASRKMPNV